MSSGKKKGLGRGLSALFGDEKPKQKALGTNQTNTVSISDLSRNPYQPRQNFSEEKLEELANSIRKNGIIHGKDVYTILTIPFCFFEIGITSDQQNNAFAHVC